MKKIKNARDFFIQTLNFLKNNKSMFPPTEYFDLAIEALEKQIPQKIITTPSCLECKEENCTGCLSDEHNPESTLCPNCKEVVQNRDNLDAYTYNYCPNCGQALNWNKE